MRIWLSYLLFLNMCLCAVYAHAQHKTGPNRDYSDSLMVAHSRFKADSTNAGLALTIGRLYENVNDYTHSITYLMKCLALSKKNDAAVRMHAYKLLAGIYHKSSDSKKAYDFHKQYTNLKDTLLQEESIRQINQMQRKYETEKKEKEIQLLNKERETQAALAESESRRKNIIILSVIGGLLATAVFAGFIFRSLRITIRQKATINEQKRIVESQKAVVEEKQKEILDSIYYARRIQLSLLPSGRYINRELQRLTKKTG